jgi:hypothetical protein
MSLANASHKELQIIFNYSKKANQMKTIQKELSRHYTPKWQLNSPYNAGFCTLFSSFKFYFNHEKFNKMKIILIPIRAKVALSLIGLAVWALVFFPASVFAQGNGKTGKAAKPTMHTTLPEAQVTATFNGQGG